MSELSGLNTQHAPILGSTTRLLLCPAEGNDNRLLSVTYFFQSQAGLLDFNF